MPIANITYNTVVNHVKSWIKSNCTNISNYNGINEVFKTGWASSPDITLASPEYTGTCIAKITRAVPQATTSNVDTDMTNFCDTYGITSRLNNNIPPSEFYHFIQDMISFICTKCVYATSQFEQGTRYLIYYPSNTSYSTTFNISSTDAVKIIKASDVTSLMTTMITVANQNIRCIPCKYSWTLSA